MKNITILFASSLQEERVRFYRMVKTQDLPYTVLFPDSLPMADTLLKESNAELIITDLEFNNGAFADWLSLWPLPFILLCSYDAASRVDELVKDEASTFLPRDSEFRHLDLLPVLIRKVINTTESRTRQNVHLQMSEREYLELVQAIPDIVYMLDSQGCFTYVNQAIESLGYRPEDLLGKHFSVLLGAEDTARVSRSVVLERYRGTVTGPENAPKLFDERRSGERMTKNLEVRLRTALPSADADAEMNARINAYGDITCVGYTLPEFAGKEHGTVGIIHDITALKENELKMQQTIESRELLLKEIHHRVKNNLQVISSLLNLQSATVKDPESHEVFQSCQAQIHSMALVHEQLYQSLDLASVDVQHYLETLCRYLSSVYEEPAGGIAIQVDAGGISLSVDQATPIALIATELVTNSMKYAFASRDTGRIDISFSMTEGTCVLSVADNGTSGNIPAAESMGMQLVRALVSQLSGTIEMSTEHGFRTVIRFPFRP